MAVTEKDASDRWLSLPSLAPLHAMSFDVQFKLANEAPKQGDDEIWLENLSEIEPIENYGIVILGIEEETGIVKNVGSYHYNPQ